MVVVEGKGKYKGWVVLFRVWAYNLGKGRDKCFWAGPDGVGGLRLIMGVLDAQTYLRGSFSIYVIEGPSFGIMVRFTESTFFVKATLIPIVVSL